MISLAHKAKQFLTTIVKLLIVGLAFWFIYKRLSDTDWLNWDELKAYVAHKNLFVGVFVVLALAFLNRFFEILKWKNLAHTLRPTSVWEASKQVLSALVFSIFTPNGIGEYGAKALFFEKSQAKQVIFLNFVCNGIQMIITIAMGILGLLLLGYFKWLGLVVSFLLIFWLLVFVLKRVTLKGYSIENLIEKIRQIPASIHRQNAILGVCRYVFFSVQQYYLFYFFGVEIGFLPVIATIMAVYLLASCLPNFQFFDFMVKGGTSIYFFGMLGINEWIVMIVALLMWVLNVVLPVSIGTILVLGFKTKNKSWGL